MIDNVHGFLHSSNIRRVRAHADAVAEVDRSRKREWTYIYQLPLENGRMLTVCKLMFLATLGYKPESTFAKNMMAATPEDSPTVTLYASGGDRNSYDREVSLFFTTSIPIPRLSAF